MAHKSSLSSSSSFPSTSILSLLIHTPFLLILHYAWNNVPISPQSLAQFGGRFRFLTLQNLFFVYLYTILSILSTLFSILFYIPTTLTTSSRKHHIQHAFNTLLSTIINPLWVISMIVMLGYYTLIHNDPELIKVANYHPQFFIHMHLQHTIGPILLTIDMFIASITRSRSRSSTDSHSSSSTDSHSSTSTSARTDSYSHFNRDATSWTTDLIILYAYATFYTMFSLTCVYMNNKWIYPFQARMNMFQHIAFYGVNYIAGTALLWVCRNMRVAMDRLVGSDVITHKDTMTDAVIDRSKNAKVQ